MTLMAQLPCNVMTMVNVFAKMDTPEANALNANHIFLETSVISVILPTMIIHPARVCLINIFIVLWNSYHALFQSVNVTLMAQLLCYVMTMVNVLAKTDSPEPNARNANQKLRGKNVTNA